MIAGARYFDSRCAGFTLLEVLVSITILASLTTLAAALWSQAASMTEDARRFGDPVRTIRVEAMLHDQWAARWIPPRAGAGEESETPPPMRATPERLSFLTTEPILFPERPLVRVEYVIERPRVSGREAAALRLAYLETIVSNPAEPWADPLPIMGETRRGEILLEHVERMGWERWDADAAGAVERARSLGLEGEEIGSVWRDVEPPAPGQEGEESEDPGTRLRAIRLTGRRAQQEFTWTLVAEDSR